jgi:hypothetical protein
MVKGEIGHRITGLAPQPVEEIKSGEHDTYNDGLRCLEELEVYVPQRLLNGRKLPIQLCQSQVVALGLELFASLDAGGSIYPFLLKLTGGA